MIGFEGSVTHDNGDEITHGPSCVLILKAYLETQRWENTHD